MDIKVKICGITNLVDAQKAMAAGADLLGFILFPKSPRYVSPEQVRDVLVAAEPGRMGVRTVGVFVNEPPQAIAQILSFCGLDLAQLHGEESPESLGLEESQSPVRGRAYKALRPRSPEEATGLANRYALPTSFRQFTSTCTFISTATIKASSCFRDCSSALPSRRCCTSKNWRIASCS